MIKVVGAYINENGKILVAKRAKGKLKGLWEFPGGKIEDSESPFDAIVREISEELSIIVVPKKIIHTFSYKYEFDTVELLLIECKVLSNARKIKTDGSHENYMWVNLHENDLSFAPLDRLIVDYLLSYKYK